MWSLGFSVDRSGFRMWSLGFRLMVFESRVTVFWISTGCAIQYLIIKSEGRLNSATYF